MERIIIGCIVGLTFAIFFAIMRSKYFAGWQKVFLGIFIIFPPVQWILALLFFLGNNVADNNPNIKNKSKSLLKNFMPVNNAQVQNNNSNQNFSPNIPQNSSKKSNSMPYNGGHNASKQSNSPSVAPKKIGSEFDGQNPYAKN